jgi:hypothetical protein
MRLFAYKVFVQYKTPLVGKVIRTEPMLVIACNRQAAARIATEYNADNKKEGELPFVDIKTIKDLGPVGEGMV